MKKYITIIISIALVLGMTQCKKRIETVTPTNEGGIHVTLRVNNGSKHSINTTNGKVAFESGDQLWVLNGSQVVGQLTCGNVDDETGEGVFSGTIGVDVTTVFGTITLDDDDYLWFCYTNNQNLQLDEGDGEDDDKDDDPAVPEFLVDMTNQSAKLPLISLGRTSQLYGDIKDNLENLTCMLYNQCALIQIILPEATSDEVILVNMCGVARLKVDKDDFGIFNDGTDFITTFNPSGSTASAERWAIVFPQEAGTILAMTYDRKIYKATLANDIFNNNMITNLEMSYVTQLSPLSIYNPLSGSWIEFAPGNLQFKTDADGVKHWRFAANQYECIDRWEPIVEDPVNNTTTYNWIDHFSFGSWYDGDYNPLSTSGYAFSDESNLGDFYSDVELNGKTGWRTMGWYETAVLFYYRPTPGTEVRGYYSATVNGQHGVILLTDFWTSGVISGATPGMQGWDNVVKSAEEWSVMESEGAVFLPAAGYHRNDASLSGFNLGTCYWINGCTYWGEQFMPYGLYLENELQGEVDYIGIGPINARDYGHTVRLVRDVVIE